jgi:hypothetical protein
VQTTDEIARLITEWRTGVADQAQRFDAASRAIDGVSVTETAAGGAIMVTVASSGIPTDLRLGDDVGRMKPDQLAAQIMACLRRAQARLADRVGAVVTDTVGDGAAAEAIAGQYQHRFPPPPDMDGEPPSPLEENADFGLSDMDAEPAPAGAPVQHQPAAPARTQHRAPARNDDEDWGAKPW